MAHDPYKYFRVEARELLEQLGQGALDLEKGVPAGEALPRLLRLAHTLKGAARVVKLPLMAEQAHRLEDVLGSLRNSTAAAAREHIDTILTLLDESAQSLTELGPVGHIDGASAATPPEEALQAFRADTGDMQHLVDGIAAAQAGIGALRPTLERADSIRHLFDLLGHQLFQLRGHAASVDGDVGGAVGALSTMDEVHRQFAALTKDIARGVDQAERELGQLSDAATRLQLVPARAMFPFLERATRDAARALGKQVTFEARGGDVRMESNVLTVLQRALLQMVRNAVAHGIETTASERRAAGKPADGRVTVAAYQRGAQVSFVCSDDGSGVDIDAVRERLTGGQSPVGGDAVRDPDAVLRLLLQGGISTATTVTGVAGRGVGLDVVRDVAERLGGHASIQTERGVGTSVALAVPFSVALVPALVVEADGVGAAVPLDGVPVVLRIAPDAVLESADGALVMYDGRATPFRSLSVVLSGSPPERSARRAVSAFVLDCGKAAAVFEVDRIVGVTPLVIRPLPALAPALPQVTGAAMGADGALLLVLDPVQLLHSTSDRDDRRRRPAAPEPASILVIDDSLTTRMLEQSILEAAGHQVTLASSGEEGLEKARRDRYALFMVDVEMPGMDGFTFVEQVRADPMLRSIPVILVTSRASAEDKLRGRQAGAQAYVVKGEFDQRVLLEHIARLVQ